MTGIFSHPFRISPQGSVATVSYGSDQEIVEAITVLATTRIGERVMCAPFGTPDPTFSQLSIADIQTGLNDFQPANVTIKEINVTQINETEATAQIRWERS